MNNEHEVLTMSKFEEVNNLVQQVGDFYAWIRDYRTGLFQEWKLLLCRGGTAEADD